MVSIRRSSFLMATSTSSASGSTATVAADVWMRPWVSVSGTRCTRCTPDSNFSLANAPRPWHLGDDFLVPAHGALGRRNQVHLPALQGCRSAPYMRNRSPANSEASSPPVPGANFEHHVALVHCVLRQQGDANILREFVAPGLQAAAARPPPSPACRLRWPGRRSVHRCRRFRRPRNDTFSRRQPPGVSSLSSRVMRT